MVWKKITAVQWDAVNQLVNHWRAEGKVHILSGKPLACGYSRFERGAIEAAHSNSSSFFSSNYILVNAASLEKFPEEDNL